MSVDPEEIPIVGSVLAVEYLGNSLLRWAIALGVFLLSLIVLRYGKRLLRRRLQTLAVRTENIVDDLILDLVRRTRFLFLLVLSLYLGLLVLDLPSGLDVGAKRFVSLILFVQLGIWANRVLTFLLERRFKDLTAEDPSRAAVLTLFGFFGQLMVWSVVVLLALENLGQDVTALIAGLGIGGVAIALALQNVLGDTFASLAIILDKPFEVGDFIIVGDQPGTVEKIGIKTTRVRSLFGEQLVFGNHDLLSSRIRNFKRMIERRILFGFGVLYQTPPDKLQAIPGMVREIIGSLDLARFDRAHFKAFGDSSLDFEVVYYVMVSDYNTYMDIQQEINLRLFRRLAEEGIEFAYPTRTLYVQGERQPVKVEVVERA